MRSSRLFAVVVGGTLLLASVLGIALQGHEGAAGSSLSRGPAGWVVARRYVETLGVETRLRRRPAEAAQNDDVLVMVFPLQRLPSHDTIDIVRRQVQLGTTLVLGYTGWPGDGAESRVLRALGLELDEAPPFSLNPWRWRQEARAEWALNPTTDDGLGGGRVRRMARVPRIPPSAEVLHRDEDGRALTAQVPFGRGHLLLVPAEALSNPRLHQPGHEALLEALVSRTHGAWTFDEYHHGLSAPGDPMAESALRAFDLWIAHGLLVYLLALLALVPRFGPAWREPPVTGGSPKAFFHGLGALAARLQFRHEAADLLMSRARELDPRVDLEDVSPSPLDDETRFLGLARTVAQAQQRRRP